MTTPQKQKKETITLERFMFNLNVMLDDSTKNNIVVLTYNTEDPDPLYSDPDIDDAIVEYMEGHGWEFVGCGCTSGERDLEFEKSDATNQLELDALCLEMSAVVGTKVVNLFHAEGSPKWES